MGNTHGGKPSVQWVAKATAQERMVQGYSSQNVAPGQWHHVEVVLLNADSGPHPRPVESELRGLGPSHPGDSGIDSRLGEGKGGMRRVIGLAKNGGNHAKFLKLWTEW